MQKYLGLAFLILLLVTLPTWANSPPIHSPVLQKLHAQKLHAQKLQPKKLQVVYPSTGHETTASQIFLIGTAPTPGQVSVNGQPIVRSPAGHFAPSFPLRIGPNQFTLRYQEQSLQINVTRQSIEPSPPIATTFGPDSLTPAVDIARSPGELLCFSAIAPPNALVSVQLADQIIPLQPQTIVNLPENSGVLTGLTQPTPSPSPEYAGCTIAPPSGELGQPQYRLNLKGSSFTQLAPGKITILSPTKLEIAQVTVPAGIARTGPSTDHSRLTPLPQGTRATITGRQGDWLRLDYGAWINRKEVKIFPGSVPVRSLIRGIISRQIPNWTEIRFPLQAPVPVSLHQTQTTLKLILHNTTAQTDTIRLTRDRLISRLDWQQPQPGTVEYTFTFETPQQWGYKLRYQGTTLILSLRHPPKPNPKSLSGFKILLDPGHGGPEDPGSVGPTGYPEKDIALLITKALRDQLVQRGATVLLTRDADIDVLLGDRISLINQQEPTIALSLHYNALPDDGDAANTQGIATFWYNAQSHDLATFLHDHLTQTLDRPSYGIYWNNLALTRPTVAPAVLLELGFMINPIEFEWITNPQAQQKLVQSLADGIAKWLTDR
ncbi:MAG: N-acetylmuramoyl-L-alanine amidase [Leptolyngbyaceae cyanobacterium CSU_1_3]|nr:N-acetylmuramoyl-L-alanine amidase [Leptolyngbyaceae cyanobacterium CSU_1_3]